MHFTLIRFLEMIRLLLTMCTVVNEVSDTVLVLFANVGDICPYSGDVIEEFTTVVLLVFLTT